MNKTKVYDLPTRLFHWLFAGLFVGAYAFASFVDDDSPWFSHHMLLGLILGCITVLRIVWGLIGSKYARFTSFSLNPVFLFRYFRGILAAEGGRQLGHNPASAWAALVMIALALGLGLTGFLMASGQKETFEDLHELMANAFAFVVVAHIAGVILHQFRHRDGIALSMIHGKKENTGGGTGIEKSHRLAAIAMAGIVGLFAFHVYKNYDASQGTTNVFGMKLQLGENESREHGDKQKSGEHERDGDDD